MRATRDGEIHRHGDYGWHKVLLVHRRMAPSEFLEQLHTQHAAEVLEERERRAARRPPEPVAPEVDEVSKREVEALKAQLATMRAELETARNAQGARKIEIITPERKVRKLGRQHVAFEKLVRYVSAGLNVALKGPAGSGKTMAAAALAKALKTDHYVVPLGPQTSKSDLLGYQNGSGDYVPSLLRRAFEHGGVVLLDEMDAANPAVLTIINGMLANGHAGFADGMVERHEGTVFLAAMNTFGRGADTEYVGRAQLDAATLDRWVLLEWDYDWGFTAALCDNAAWTGYVRTVHEAVTQQRVRAVVGPRAALHGALLLAAGVGRDEVEHAVIWAPIKPDDQAKIRAALPVQREEPVIDFAAAPEPPVCCPVHKLAEPSRRHGWLYCPARQMDSPTGYCRWQERAG